jgi:hypothetical protein
MNTPKQSKQCFSGVKKMGSLLSLIISLNKVHALGLSTYIFPGEPTALGLPLASAGIGTTSLLRPLHQ